MLRSLNIYIQSIENEGGKIYSCFQLDTMFDDSEYRFVFNFNIFGFMCFMFYNSLMPQQERNVS